MNSIQGYRARSGNRRHNGATGKRRFGIAPRLLFAAAVPLGGLPVAVVLGVAPEAYARVIVGTPPGDTCFGAAPTIYCKSGNVCYGTSGNDVIWGTNADDEIHAKGGNDYVCGRRGSDLIYGHNGNDSISGGPGADTLRGGRGDDVLNGDGGKDRLVGSEGSDRLYGGDDVDTIEGNGGADMIDGGNGGDTIHAGAGADTVAGGNGDDTIYGGDGADKIFGEQGNDHLYGEDGQDTIDGGPDADVISGGPQGDFLDGGSGNDELSGNGGDDLLFGNIGNSDSCNGGAGVDTNLGETCEEVQFVEIPEQESPGGAGAICDIWNQDCPDDYKCIPDGLEGTPRCRPIDDNPDQIGDSCQPPGENGGDSCDIDGMCVQGVCVALCEGQPAAPDCSHSSHTSSQCHFYPNGPALCEQSCDPLASACREGRVCAAEPGSLDFTCSVVPEAQALPALPGQACTSMAQCQGGHACMQANQLEFGYCDDGAVSCCAPMCDLNEGGFDCPGDHACIPYFASAPPGLEHVGVCAITQ